MIKMGRMSREEPRELMEIHREHREPRSSRDHRDHRDPTQSREPKEKDDFVDELRSFEFWRSVIGECVGTYFLLFISSCSGASEETTRLEQALTVGLSMVFLTHVFLPVSGSHLNPAITMTRMCLKQVSPVKALLFVVAQCGGAISGCGTVIGLLGAKTKLTPTSISDLGPEFILTFIMAIVYFHSIKQPDLEAAIIIGAVHTALLSSAQFWINPLRAFGPVFLSNQFQNHWVVWLGTSLGALAGGISYQFIFCEKVKKQSESQCIPNTNNVNEDMEGQKCYRLLQKQHVLKEEPVLQPEFDVAHVHSPAPSRILKLDKRSFIFSPPRYKRNHPEQRRLRDGNLDVCVYNLEQEKSLTDDELHRSSRNYTKEFIREPSMEQFSGSSSGYYSNSWDRAENYDTEDELCTGEMYDTMRRARRITTTGRRPKKIERKPSKKRSTPIQKSFSTSY